MNFSTITKSAPFQYVINESTKARTALDVQELEYNIIQKFNKHYIHAGITLHKYSEHLALSFIIVAESTYKSEEVIKTQHPTYNDILLSTAYLSSITEKYNLKCTRRGV